MPQRQFLISASGYIYECTQGSLRDCQPGGKGTRLLGHISCLLREQTSLGKKIRRWWEAYLESAESSQEGDSLPSSPSKQRCAVANVNSSSLAH